MHLHVCIVSCKSMALCTVSVYLCIMFQKLAVLMPCFALGCKIMPCCHALHLAARSCLVAIEIGAHQICGVIVFPS